MLQPAPWCLTVQECSAGRLIAVFTRCTVLLPVSNSRATFSTPLPLASAARIAASFWGLILARPIGFPLLVPIARARAMPA